MMSDILLMHHVAIHGDEYFESLFDGLGQRDIGPDANQDFRPTICASTSCQDVRLGILEQRDDLFAFNAREALQKLLD